MRTILDSASISDKVASPIKIRDEKIDIAFSITELRFSSDIEEILAIEEYIGKIKQEESEGTTLAFSLVEPRNVKEFLSQKNLEETYKFALELIAKHIPNSVEVRGTLKKDTVTGDWVELYVIVDDDLDSLTVGENAFLDEWIGKTTVEEGQRLRVDYKFAK